MKVIPPDFSRQVDLPGVGPCDRPVDIDQAVTGFSDLVSLRVYAFRAGATIDGEAEADEVLIVLLGGAATVEVTGAHAARFALAPDGDRAVYLPPRHHYRLLPDSDATVAYARARPTRAGPPAAYAPARAVLAIDEGPERLRLRLFPLGGAETDASDGLDPGTERLAHLTGPACVRWAGHALPVERGRTLALESGETAHVSSEGKDCEVLVVGAV